jgi:alpha-mannosidase II
MFLLVLLLFFGAPSHQEHIDMKAVVHELPFANPDGGAWKQGWRYEWNNNDENAAKVLNVFVVPHSHNDPGWLQTFEDYYQSRTKGILNSVFRALDEDHNRHFIWAEISFFSRWWQDIDTAMKNTVRAVLQRGQLEFVTGGWVMNDEATSYYYSILVQLYEGHNWLQEELNYKPEYAWSIDPFGHSPVQAFFYNLTGFHAMLIQR